ncbi:CPBP family intramembrane glutamic endopeptidase [Eudoraea chungangensis]|uniref:CPBP family intramembrane glutamic endopeptidase n=1 Tax=Eudoraea chungangensis TaxID=1481905 RepID=UPI0023EE179D|nr:type II CAAX endopeptidase family protein [Eudoraea chungangensis]
MLCLQKKDLGIRDNKESNVWARICAIIIAYISIGGMFQYIGGHLLDIDLTNNGLQHTTYELLILIFCSFLGTFVVMYLFLKFVDREAIVKLGFQGNKMAKELCLGFSLGLLFMGIGSVLLLALNEVVFSKIVFATQEVVLTLLLYLMVSVMEEVIFRGYVLRKLLGSINIYWALLVSSSLFAFMHVLNPHFTILGLFNIFLSGIILGLGYIYTKNLWFSIAFHFSWNLFQSFFGFNVSGENTYNIIVWHRFENNLYNGGDFGMEGSVLCLGLQIFILVFMAYYGTQDKV